MIKNCPGCGLIVERMENYSDHPDSCPWLQAFDKAGRISKTIAERFTYANFQWRSFWNPSAGDWVTREGDNIAIILSAYSYQNPDPWKKDYRPRWQSDIIPINPKTLETRMQIEIGKSYRNALDKKVTIKDHEDLKICQIRGDLIEEWPEIKGYDVIMYGYPQFGNLYIGISKNVIEACANHTEEEGDKKKYIVVPIKKDETEELLKNKESLEKRNTHPDLKSKEYFEYIMRGPDWPMPWKLGETKPKFRFKMPCPCCNGNNCARKNTGEKIRCPECLGTGSQYI